jgi:hypothetical protein
MGKSISQSIKPKPADPSSAPAAPAKPSVAPFATNASQNVVSVKPEKPNAVGVSGITDVSGAKGTLRVAVRVSARDESLYIVRPLEPGQRVPPGSREARLVFEQDA